MILNQVSDPNLLLEFITYYLNDVSNVCEHFIFMFIIKMKLDFKRNYPKKRFHYSNFSKPLRKCYQMNILKSRSVLTK